MEINALDILNRRKIDFIPRHFSKMKINDNEANVVETEFWIKNKLRGRYFFLKAPLVLTDGKLRSNTVVGFEDHKELTYFMLACPHLRRK